MAKQTPFKHTMQRWLSDFVNKNREALTGICSVWTFVYPAPPETQFLSWHGLLQTFHSIVPKATMSHSLSLWPDTGLSLPGYAKPARFLVFYQYYRQQECDINLIGVSGARQMYKRQTIVKSNGYFHFSLLFFSSVASPCDTVTLAFAHNKLLTVFWLMKNNTDESCENQPNPN